MQRTRLASRPSRIQAIFVRNGGTYNRDFGTCQRDDGLIYDSQTAQGWAAEGVLEIGVFEDSRGKYIAPTKYERPGVFHLVFVDGEHLHQFDVVNGEFHLVKVIKETKNYVEAMYRLMYWDRAEARDGAFLVYPPLVRIRSTLVEYWPGRYTGGFWQVGRAAGGHFYYP